MKPANISNQRILAEVKKLNNQKLEYLKAGPLPDDLYTWHFTFQGPENTQFHQGLYHGQILLPYQYPFKPPDIVFMNKNGRFQVNTKICLTITQYHPEQWNSAWTIRTMLEAVISLFAQNVQGVGSLSSSSDVRTFLAKSSQSYVCEKCGPIKDLLHPRQPQEVKKQKKEEQKVEEKIQRKQSQVVRPPTQLPSLANIFSQRLYTKLRQRKKQVAPQQSQQTNTNEPYLYYLPKRMKQQLKHREQPPSKTEPNPSHQIIHLKNNNYDCQQQLGFKQYTKKVERNMNCLNRVHQSIRWV